VPCARALRTDRAASEAARRRARARVNQFKAFTTLICQFNPRIRYLCNRAAAYLGAGYHIEALKDCDLALSLDPLLDKALLRRALAREALGKHKAAIVDVQQLLGRTQFGSALHTRALDLKRRLDRLLWQEAHTQETNQAAHLFTSEQTLRLNFRTPPPGAVAVGDYFEVSVFVANEFGLFGSKQFEAQQKPVQLQVPTSLPQTLKP
jgi:tetratricopeptide (TPR) repeat protein